jgi:hypothetical protein
VRPAKVFALVAAFVAALAGMRTFWPTWITERVDSLVALSRLARVTPWRDAMPLRVSPERTV